MLFFVLNHNILSSHITHIIEHIISSNQKNHSYDQMSKMIVNLVFKKCESDDTYSCQLTRIHDLLLLNVFDTPEKDLSNIDCKYNMIKVPTSSVNLSSTLFPCSIRAMYNWVNCNQKQCPVLKSYLSGTNISIFQREITIISFLKTT